MLPCWLGGDDYNNINNVNANYNFNNNGRARGIVIAHSKSAGALKTNNCLYEKLYSWENLVEAYKKAKRGKGSNSQVREFEAHWKLHLATLYQELKNFTYNPLPLITFVLRDPKTRTICVSDFRDRIVHHAIINILQPIFEPRFIHDSYASRKGKGTIPALNRAKLFIRKVSHNGQLVSNARCLNDVKGFVLKADVFRYFENVDHATLILLLRKRVCDEKVINLVETILHNYHSERAGTGMPLGNWTSQFFANVYLHELDRFVKCYLRAKYYIRYVDDFVIFHKSRKTLAEYQNAIVQFLKTLHLELHPQKCSITPLRRGVPFLGFKLFYHHTIVRRRNVRTIINLLREELNTCTDIEFILNKWKGWCAYASYGNTHSTRRKIEALLYTHANTLPGQS